MEGIVVGEAKACAPKVLGRAWPFAEPHIANDQCCGGTCAMARVAGFHACFTSPILGELGDFIGILALYAAEPRCASDAERELLLVCRELCELTLRRHGRAQEGEERSMIDALTGLRNRAAFDARLATLRSDQPGAWAMIVLDLDNLKQVNDTLGHEAGDGLIRTAGQRLATVMAPDIAYRLGGDEFAVIVERPEVLRDLEATASEIFAALEATADCDGHSIVPAASMGGAVAAGGDDGAAGVYQNADFALYHAKETGRAIREVALALDDERVEAYYQPIVELDTRKIAAVEALCRLRTSSGAVVPARNFRDAVTDARVATALTDRMLSIVSKDVRRWHNAGLPFQQVSLNISTADLIMGDLMGKLENSFGCLGMPLNRIVLEVSEGISAGRDDKVVARQIERLRQSGV